MKILYGIQATGNGHLSRAKDIIPELKKYGELDLLVSGTTAEVQLDHPIKFKHKGFGFTFGNRGGIDFVESFKNADVFSLIKDIRNVPAAEYDLILSDFEPVSAWAAKLRKAASVGISHQAAFLSSKVPVISGIHYGDYIMKTYAPTTESIGFHYERYDNFIYTPIIRQEIRNLKTSNAGHYTAYLPAYHDDIIFDHVSNFPEVKWHIFSKKTKTKYSRENVEFFPVSEKDFLESLASCEGFLTGGGFQGTSEALFLGKKLLVVPMFHQFEQQSNAKALEDMGAAIIWSAEDWKKLEGWLQEGVYIKKHYPDLTAEIIKNIMDNPEKYFNKKL